MWLVLGGDGQLGRCIGEVLEAGGITHVRLGSAACDVTRRESVLAAVEGHAPSVIVNAAAWTAVDDAEDNEDRARLVNGDGAGNVAGAASAVNARLIHVSTDYVFDGRSSTPYASDHPPAPVGAYGRTKHLGEMAVTSAAPGKWHILRTAWLYSRHGRNFAKTMVGRALRGEAARVVDDQRGQPTSAMDLARLMVEIVAADARPGVYHATNSGETTWFGFARAIYELSGADPSLVSPTSSASYPTRAVRPAYSVLDHSSFAGSGVAPMRHWGEALAEVIDSIVAQVALESEN